MLKHELTENDIIWIKEIIRRIDSKEEIDYKIIAAALVNRISSEYNPYSIDKNVYILPPCSVTLSGIIKFGDGNKWLSLVDKIIRHIKDTFLQNTKLEEISSNEIATSLHISVQDVEVSLDLIRPLGYFWNQSSGNLYKCDRIRFFPDECFREYCRYTSIDELLSRFERRMDNDQRVYVDTCINSDMSNLFIIMPMASEKPLYEDVLNTIKSVANQFNIHAFRIDEDQSNERITDRILDSIRNSNYIVADLTDVKPNVFFEAGYSLGIDKVPIFIAHEGTKIEFDVKDYPIIFFKNQTNLREKLSDRIKVIIEYDAGSTQELNHTTDKLPLAYSNPEDVKTILSGWVQTKIDSKLMLNVFKFSDIDKECQLPEGSTKSFLKDIVLNKGNYVIENEGPNTIKFMYGPISIQSARVFNNRINYDNY